MANILIVEDVEILLTIYKEVLEEEGHKVFTANTGEKGIQLHLENPNKFKILILDIILPDANGLDILQKIKAINEKIKILVITGGGPNRSPQSIIKAKKLGADASLFKPFKPNDLLKEINSLLGF